MQVEEPRRQGATEVCACRAKRRRSCVRAFDLQLLTRMQFPLRCDIVVKLDNELVADHASAILAGNTCWPSCGHGLWNRVAQAQASQLASGGCGHSARWIKGHSTELDVLTGVISAEDRRGNQAADRLASLAACVNSCPTNIIERTNLRKLQTLEVKQFLVEVLLSRRLVLLERREAHIETNGAPASESSRPLLDLPQAQAIQAAFHSLHCL